MPSAYTEQLLKGITFQRFAMICARGMGALIMMRDEPLNAEIPAKFRPGTYHTRALRKAQKRLETVSAMNLKDCAAASKAAFQKAKAYHDKQIAERSEFRLKYEQMLEEVNAWNPPTREHVGMKEFMAEQIVQGLNFDCDTSYYEEHPPIRLSAKDWKAAEIAAASKDIAYYQEAHDEEVARTNDRNTWIKDLRKSLAVATK